MGQVFTLSLYSSNVLSLTTGCHYYSFNVCTTSCHFNERVSTFNTFPSRVYKSHSFLRLSAIFLSRAIFSYYGRKPCNMKASDCILCILLYVGFITIDQNRTIFMLLSFNSLLTFYMKT